MSEPFSTGKDSAFVQPGAAGTVLTSNGSGANPSYQAIPANPDAPAPGATGTVLTSNGPSLAPTYQAPQDVAPTTIIISSAELLAIAASPVIVIPAPGPGKVLMLRVLIARYVFGTTPYTLGNADNSFEFGYTSSPIDFDISVGIAAAGFVDQSVNVLAGEAYSLIDGNFPEATIVNQPIELALNGTTPGLTLGDGTLEIQYLATVFTL